MLIRYLRARDLRGTAACFSSLRAAGDNTPSADDEQPRLEIKCCRNHQVAARHWLAGRRSMSAAWRPPHVPRTFTMCCLLTYSASALFMRVCQPCPTGCRPCGDNSLMECISRLVRCRRGCGDGGPCNSVARARTLASCSRHDADGSRKVLGVTQARVSNIKRGKISQFSLDLLFRLAARAGLQPKVKIAA
jgi:hypothetical protein